MAPYPSFLVFGTVSNSLGVVISNAKLNVKTSVGEKNFFTDSNGLYVYDLADVGYVSGETVTVDVTEPYNNEIQTQTYVVTGDFLEENIVTQERKYVQNITDYPIKAILHSVGKSPITNENPLPVTAVLTSPLGSNGAVPVNIQDQSSKALDLKFIQSTNSTTLSADANPDDTTITVTATTGFVDGKVVGIFSVTDGTFYFGKQVGAVAGNVVTLDTPLDRPFSSGDLSVAAIDNMNVDGSVTTQIFRIGPVGGGADVEIDITRLMGFIADGVAMDDGKFGGIAALTNGIVLRHNNSIIDNIWNMKTNGELGLLCFDIAYTDKAPAGENGFRFRNTYASPDKHGVVIRLEPGDTLEILIQDDLTELTTFNMMAQGHIVED